MIRVLLLQIQSILIDVEFAFWSSMFDWFERMRVYYSDRDKYEKARDCEEAMRRCVDRRWALIHEEQVILNKLEEYIK